MIFNSMRTRFLALVLCLVLTMSLSMGIALANGGTVHQVGTEQELLTAIGVIQSGTAPDDTIVLKNDITTQGSYTTPTADTLNKITFGNCKWTVSAGSTGAVITVIDTVFWQTAGVEIDTGATGLTVVYPKTFNLGDATVSGNLETISYKEGGTDDVTGQQIPVSSGIVSNVLVASTSSKKAPKTVEKMKISGTTYRLENVDGKFWKEYTITYVFSETQDGQTISGPISGVTNGNPTYYTEKTTAFYLKDPVKSGYKLVGWVDGGTIKQSSEILVQPTDKENKTYTAIFYKTSGDGQKGGMNIDASALLEAVEEEETEEEEEETNEPKHVHISMASSGVSSKIKGVTDSMNLNDLLGYQGGESDSSSSVPLIIIGSVLIASALVGIVLLIKKK